MFYYVYLLCVCTCAHAHVFPGMTMAYVPLSWFRGKHFTNLLDLKHVPHTQHQNEWIKSWAPTDPNCPRKQTVLHLFINQYP